LSRSSTDITAFTGHRLSPLRVSSLVALLPAPAAKKYSRIWRCICIIGAACTS
jgi:hypothetical protein